MAVDNTSASSGPYTANGVTTVFPFTFIAAGVDEISVTVNGSPLDRSAYRVTLDDTGAGSILITPALVSGTIYIASDPSFQQTADFQRSGPYFPDFVNKPFDRAAIRDIYLLDKLERTLIPPLGVDMVDYIKSLLGFNLPSGSVADSLGSSVSVAPSQRAVSEGLNFKNTGLLPVIRTMASRDQLEVYASDYQGFDAGGGTTSRDAILRAADALPTGGTIRISAREAVLVDSNMDLPSGVSIRGPLQSPGFKKNNANPTAFHTLGGRLIINPSATIKLGGGGGVSGLVVHPKNMTFPQNTPSSFAGTAFTINGDDVSINTACIIGFNQIISSNGYARGQFRDMLIDGQNGIDLSNCLDIARITDVHAWPFATIQPGGAWQNLTRTGKAFYIHDTADHTKLTGIFAYGYLLGLHLKNVNSTVGLGCGFDNPFDTAPLYVGSKGMLVEGASERTRIAGFQSSAMDSAGAEINVSASCGVSIEGAVWVTGGTGCAYRVNGGDVHLDGMIDNHTTGIEVNNAQSRIKLSDTFRFRSVTQPVKATTTNRTMDFGRPQFDTTFPLGQQMIVGSGTIQAQTVASADPVLLPMNGDVFRVTGTTSFGSMYGGWLGRRVTLIFGGSLTVFNGSAGFNSIRLLGGGNFTSGALSTLTFCHDGTQWFEVGRS